MTINQENFRLRIVNDDAPENPFLAWDCEPEVAWDFESIENTDGIVKDILNKLTISKVKYHQKKLAEILDIEFSDDADLGEKHYEIEYEISRTNLENLSKVCDLLKIPNLYYGSRGYCQGDYADVLIVCTDKFYETTGAKKSPKANEKTLNAAKSLFDAWAWGDVYGFIIEEVDEDGKWDHIDSCGGFYGTDHKESGLYDYIDEEYSFLIANEDLYL